ncbi:HD domain-containing protein [Maricaulaceae bacterium MS644]
MTLTSRYADALVFAATAHREQTRKGTAIPYLSHLMSVSALVLEYGGDEDQAIAGLLHDAIEDQGGAAMEAQIRERFGDRVAQIVRACTDSDAEPKPPWRARKEAYLATLRDKSDDALLVSQCDKLHNATAILNDARIIGPAIWDRFTGKRDGTIWYYQSLAAIFAERRPGPLAERFARTVSEMETLA